MLIIGEKLSIIAKRVREAMMKKIRARYRRSRPGSGKKAPEL
jgi:ribonuclease HII